MKLGITKSKNSASFYVQKTIREGAKTRTVTVEKIGNLEEVKTKAKGQDPYKWAQEYVNELNRKAYEENKEIIQSYSPTKLIKKGEQKSFNCGYLFLQQVYYSLGLDKICKDITGRHKFKYDLNDILSKLIYTRILYPSSKKNSLEHSRKFLEQPSFNLKEIYRSLDILEEENDFIQSQLYKNSQKVLERRKDILYYDCTNFYFETEQADDFRKYGKAKQHQPLPLVGMGLFMDYDGIPLAFDVFPGNKNEQPTLKPIEKRIIDDYGLDKVIVCTDAGLSSTANRKFNDKKINGAQVRGFITTQSIKKLPDYLKEFALSNEGWLLPGSEKTYNLNELDAEKDYDKIFYKKRWITEDISEKKKKSGKKPLEQNLIVSFSLKYMNYQKRIRDGQVDRAQALIDSGKYKQRPKNQNDPTRFIKRDAATADGEICEHELVYLNKDAIAEEAKYDGFYAVCTNIKDATVEQIIRVNKQRWEIEECFRIMKTEFKSRPAYVWTEPHIRAHFLTCYLSLMVFKILEKKLDEKYTCEQIIDTLKGMMMAYPHEKQGYIPAYTRTELTDLLHETAGFRTDTEIVTDLIMRKNIRLSMNKKK